ncbi:DUF6344 domain-containing protein [Streptomyces sp. NPDC015131]|uniref:DUF6344 domain-containing protein n=1 Tax=Streptomyces sp. NPDC015131 TaxID=3364941 RepID=UPI0036F655B4
MTDVECTHATHVTPATHANTTFWTALFSLLTAILTALGLKRTPKASVPVIAAPVAVPPARAARAARSAAHSPAPAPAPDPVPLCCAPAWGPGRVRSLPPTIKQRIRAEAHGSSPSVRRLPAFAVPQPADASDPTVRAAVTTGATTGAVTSTTAPAAAGHGTAGRAAAVDVPAGRTDLALAA